MNKIAKKYISLAVIIVFMSMTVSCTTCKDMPINSAYDVQRLRFEPEKKYDVQFTDGKFYKLTGKDLVIRGDLVGVRFKGVEGYKYYRREQFRKICAREKSRGKTIGLIVGGVVGGLALIGGIVAGVLIAGLSGTADEPVR